MSDEALVTPWNATAIRVAQVDEHPVEKLMRQLNDAAKGRPEYPQAVLETLPLDVPVRQPHWSDDIPPRSDWEREFLRSIPRPHPADGSAELLTDRQLEFLAEAQRQVETLGNAAPLAMPSIWDMESGRFLVPRPQLPTDWQPVWGRPPALDIPEYVGTDARERLQEDIGVIKKLHAVYPESEPIVPPPPQPLPPTAPPPEASGGFFDRMFDWDQEMDAERQDLNDAGAQMQQLTGELVEALKGSYRDFMEAAEQLDIILRSSILNHPPQSAWEEQFRMTGRTTGPREGGRSIEWHLIDNADDTVEWTALVVKAISDYGLEISDKIREIVDLRSLPRPGRCGGGLRC